jgi:hypothetical protein
MLLTYISSKFALNIAQMTFFSQVKVSQLDEERDKKLSVCAKIPPSPRCSKGCFALGINEFSICQNLEKKICLLSNCSLRTGKSSNVT